MFCKYTISGASYEQDRAIFVSFARECRVFGALCSKVCRWDGAFSAVGRRLSACSPRIEVNAARCLRRMAKKSPMARVSRFVVHSNAGKGEDFLEKAGDFRRKVPCFFQFRLSLRKWERMCGQTAVGESRQRGERTEKKEQKNEARKKTSGGGGGHAPKSLRQKNPRSHKKSGDGKLSLRFVGETAVVRLFDHLLRGAGKYQFS